MSLVKSSDFIERGKCPLCGSINSEKHIDFPDIPVVCCQDCNFMFSSRLMSREVLSKYYVDGFGSLRQLQGQRVNAEINFRVLSKMLDLSTPGRLLDVGTGYGFFLNKIVNGSNLQATGVELSKQEAEYGRDRLGLEIHDAPLNTIGFPEESFDIVASFEVLEHIPEPRLFLNELRDVLKKDGYLLIMTDNFDSDLVKSMGAGFPKWIPHTHVSHFGARTFERIVTETGFDIVKRFSYTPWEFLLKHFSQRVLGREKSLKDSFNLSEMLEFEVHGTYKLFRLRFLLNKLWVQCQGHDNLEGTQMFLLARKC
ncbi:MAG: class I SAM-dependent methyltransferase [Geobacteraceae bacterium]|nr:class I SAM-dependent methyltransferase [Geobacteraceae bacterium]